MKGQSEQALYDVAYAIDRPGGAARVVAMFQQDPKLRIKFVEAVNLRLDQITEVTGAKKSNKFLVQINQAKVLSDAELAALTEKYRKIVVAGNESGRLRFTLDSETLSLYGLETLEQSQKVFERTLRQYEDKDFAYRNIDAILSYVRATGQEKRLIERLPHLNIRGSELALIQTIAPEFAAKRKGEITLDAYLDVKNADRIFADDLGSALGKSIYGVAWLSGPSRDAVQVVVDRVRYTEKETSPAMRTVTYSNGQVDILSAALLMPKNASYQFDLRTGGAEIEYGYVVSAWRDGKKLSEGVVRGKVGGEYRKCENARVVNVFGGVSAAGFMANDDMRRACSGPTTVSMDDLRGQVLEKITAQVRSIPEIERVHAMN